MQVFELSDEPLEIALLDDNVLSAVVVTSRRRSETVQEIPISVSVIGGDLVEDAGAFNVNRVKELVPSVQLYSSNPRNTGLPPPCWLFWTVMVPVLLNASAMV